MLQRFSVFTLLVLVCVDGFSFPVLQTNIIRTKDVKMTATEQPAGEKLKVSFK